ncbi:MAG: hypothetical protein NC251_10745 [Lachnoclostridium sp.]|nr:hypothetical protein [Lachnospira sp.]MCM1248897.1 hypothetical protein [Lachnoclostridium sp.]
MSFCKNCGRELGPDEVCDCQKTQEAEAAGATAATTGTDATAAPDAGAAATGTDATAAPDAGAAATGTDATAAFNTATAPYSQTASASDAGTGSNGKKGPIALIAGAAAVVLVLLVVLVASLMGSGSYKTPVKDLVKLINKQSTDAFAYMELTDPISTDYTRSVYNILKKNEDMKEEFDDLKNDIADFYEDIAGFKITKCDFVASKEMKKKDLRSIEDSVSSSYLEDLIEEIDEMDNADYEDMADELDISKSDAKKFAKETKSYLKTLSKIKVTKGYEVTIRFYGKYDGETDKTDKIDVRIIKVNGKWRIYNMSSLFNQLDFDKDLSDVDLSSLYYLINDVDLGYFR